MTVILSRERRLAVATRIGVVWGLGHTLTVLTVGAAIIIFKLAVPARLGLAMEFAVAMVLILLGLGTVGALMRRIASRLFRTSSPDAEDLVVHSHSHTHGGAPHRHPHVHHHPREYSGVIDCAAGEFHREHGLPLAHWCRSPRAAPC